MSNSYRTELAVSPSDWSINHQSGILTLGSCFSEEIGARFSNHRFVALPNPFGTVYNPISIGQLIQWSLGNSIPSTGQIEHNGVHSNLHFHSAFNGLTEGELNESIRGSVKKVHDFLPKMEFLIITLGTAWVYRHRKSGEIINNCHKLPSSHFEKVLLSTKDVIGSLEKDLLQLVEQYPTTKIILTVSPVRHLKDGMEMNSLSKSILRIACHHLAENHSYIDYFPSFELVMDDLRDYRFYSSDLIHPNAVATDYIWEKFGLRYFREDTLSLNKSIASIQKAIAHSPFLPKSSEHILFLEETLLKLTMLNEKINLQEEIQEIKNRILIAKLR